MTTSLPALRLRRLDLAGARRDPAVATELETLVRRGAVPDETIREAVRRIVAAVERDGAAAVREANRSFGGGLADGRLFLERADLSAALDRLAPSLRRALEAAIANVRRFAEAQRPTSVRVVTVDGVEIERRWVPLDRVGAYAPGGRAPYPSSLVMGVVPGQVAGVGAIVAASPAGPDGSLEPVLAGAAGLLGLERLLVAGGAQAIAALAFGLPDEGCPPVDRIVGPGNAYVTAAKLELAGRVGIDLPAGPSEGMVLADASGDPEIVAADLLTQAEHGPDSPAILVTTEPVIADAVEAALLRQLVTAPRRAILEAALATHGRIVLAPDLEAAVGFINAYAPEHLSIEVAEPETVVAQIRNAGSVFVGPWAPESAGDYATGANHVLPTGGLARACGALAVDQYGRYLQIQRLSEAGLAALRPTIGELATAEGLFAHRAAVEIRFARLGRDDESRFVSAPDDGRRTASRPEAGR